VTPAEQKIFDLSAKVIALQDTPEFSDTVQELREAIHNYLSCVHDKLADLAFLIANESESKAAD
jgi:hypothetical protein